MLDHHLQRAIVNKLAFSTALRFSDLKPSTIDNKLFTYHLKKVINAGLVEKEESGNYLLTPEGRRLGLRVLDRQLAVIDRAESVLFLVVKRKTDGQWLLYRRNAHPLIGKVGFMHATPVPSLDSSAAASEALEKSTGLIGSFNALGGGYFRIFDNGDLESFTHFTLMVCEDAEGDLIQVDSQAEYFWENDPDFLGPDMLPNMKILVDYYEKGETFFIDHSLSK